MPRHASLAPCPRVFLYGASWSHLTGLDCPAVGILAVWSISQLPAWENLHGLVRAPLPDGAIMDTVSNLSQCRILALSPDAGDLISASAECPRPKSHPSLCSQTSALTFLAPKPSRLATLEPQCSSLPSHQKKNVALGSYPERPDEDPPARHSTALQF